MSDPNETPDLGGFIPRKQFIEVLESMGLDPRNTHSMYMDRDGVHATEYVVGDDGARQLHPDDRTQVWTREVFYAMDDA